MLSDTSFDADNVQLRLLREKSPVERLAMALRLTTDVLLATKRAIARSNPELTAQQIGQHFVALHYGRQIEHVGFDITRGSGMADINELVQALRPVVTELNRLGVRHYVGGSVASSMHGAARSTLDVDLAAELDETTALSLVDSLQHDYYISKKTVLEAVRHRTCFNLIHLATSFKVDIFVSQRREFDGSAQDRAITEVIGGTNGVLTRVATAEDVILLKLEWYRLGNETSERQWNDITAVARLQSDQLDSEYLRHWAQNLA